MKRLLMKDKNGKPVWVTVPSPVHEVAWYGDVVLPSDECDENLYVDNQYVVDGYVEIKCN